MNRRYKIIIAVLAIALIALASLLAFDHLSKQKNEKRAQETIQSELDEMYLRAASMAQSLAVAMNNADVKSTEDIARLIKNHLEKTPEVFGSAVAFQPYSFNDTIEFVAPYYYRGPTGLIYKDLSSNYPSWVWYKKAVESGKPGWGEPYFDEGAGNIEMVSYSHPFFKNGKIWGVASADVSIQELRKLTGKIKE